MIKGKLTCLNIIASNVYDEFKYLQNILIYIVQQVILSTIQLLSTKGQ